MSPATADSPGRASFAQVDVDDTIDSLERRIHEPRARGKLEAEAVEALDVVYHALVFAKEPRGLELWREALWRQELAPEARNAIARMLEYLNGAVSNGQSERVAAICDCLENLFTPSSHA